MTEAEWLDCANPRPMLEAAGGRLNQRQFRLFATACCRRIWGLMSDDLCRRAVEVAERFADGRADEQERAEAAQQVSVLCDSYYAQDWDWAPAVTAFLAWNAAGRSLIAHLTPVYS